MILGVCDTDDRCTPQEIRAAQFPAESADADPD
jgi:hypothetical protein